MTKTKTILGLSLAAVFAVSMLGSAYAGGHLTIVDVEISKSEAGKNLLDIHITVGADIPETGSAFGYGVVGNAGFNNVLALTSHSGILDHSSQEDKDDGILHPHVLDLKAATDACGAAELEVDLAKTVKTKNNFDAPYDTVVDDEEVWVTGVPRSDLAGQAKVVVAFTIEPLFDGDDLTNLCLTLKSSKAP